MNMFEFRETWYNHQTTTHLYTITLRNLVVPTR